VAVARPATKAAAGCDGEQVLLVRGPHLLS
jgi:hypothetical protein